jgi:hypothetical protein
MCKIIKFIILYLLLIPLIGNAGDAPTMMRVIDAEVYTGKGTASISYQCDQEAENPCPPKTELKRRALEVARIYAMQDISQKSGVTINSVMMVMSGRMKAGKVKAKSGNKLKSIEFLDPIVRGDEISIKIVAEVE